MIRDRYGKIWAGREDLAASWGSEAADTVWDDMLDRYHLVRTLVEEGGTPRLDPDGIKVGWDDLIPLETWAPLVPECRGMAKDISLGDGMTRKLQEIERERDGLS